MRFYNKWDPTGIDVVNLICEFCGKTVLFTSTDKKHLCDAYFRTLKCENCNRSTQEGGDDGAGDD